MFIGLLCKQNYKATRIIRVTSVARITGLVELFGLLLGLLSFVTKLASVAGFLASIVSVSE